MTQEAPPTPQARNEVLFEQTSVEARSRVAGSLGLTALSLVMIGPCTCFTTVFVGAILGAGAAIAGMRVRAEEPSRAGDAWAQTGIGAGGMAAVAGVIGILILIGLAIMQVLGTISFVEWVQSLS